MAAVEELGGRPAGAEVGAGGGGGRGLDDDALRQTRPEAAGDGVGEGRVMRRPAGVGLGLNG
jgi:hypothetical protein